MSKKMKVGTANVSVAHEVAAVQRLLKASGLTYTMHSAGTTVGQSSFPHPHVPHFSLLLFFYFK